MPPSMMKRACCRGAMSGCCRDLREGFFGSGLRPLMCSALASANASRALSDELVPTKWHASCFSPTSTCTDPNTYTSHVTEVASLAFHPVPPTSTYRHITLYHCCPISIACNFIIRPCQGIIHSNTEPSW